MSRRRVAAVLLAIMAIASHASAQATPRASGGAAFERLRTNIEQIARSVDTHWGIYIKCLETSEEIAINADEAMDTMSVIKLPLMVEAFRQIALAPAMDEIRHFRQRRRQRRLMPHLVVDEQDTAIGYQLVILLGDIILHPDGARARH